MIDNPACPLCTEAVACTLVSMPACTIVRRRKLHGCLDAIAKVSAFARMNPTLR